MKTNAELLGEIEASLRDLELLFPLAGDRLEQLTALYTTTYMFKLRAMKC